jgi:hypothetical protein
MGVNPSLFEDAKIYKVYFKLGSFGKDNPKYYPAPFQILLNSEGQFIQPCNLGDLSSYALNYSIKDSSLYQAKHGDGWIQLGKELVFDEHEWGDFEGHPSDFRGVHAFGLI